MHVIAAKAIAFGECLKPEWKTYSAKIVTNARQLAKTLIEKGYKLASRGTDNHLVLVDLRPIDSELTGKQAAVWLEQVGIIANMNTVPNESRSPMQTSGIRLGTPALTTRGLGEKDIELVAGIIDRTFRSKGEAGALAGIKKDVLRICARFPMKH